MKKVAGTGIYSKKQNIPGPGHYDVKCKLN